MIIDQWNELEEAAFCVIMSKMSKSLLVSSWHRCVLLVLLKVPVASISCEWRRKSLSIINGLGNISPADLTKVYRFNKSLRIPPNVMRILGRFTAQEHSSKRRLATILQKRQHPIPIWLKGIRTYLRMHSETAHDQATGSMACLLCNILHFNGFFQPQIAKDCILAAAAEAVVQDFPAALSVLCFRVTSLVDPSAFSLRTCQLQSILKENKLWRPFPSYASETESHRWILTIQGPATAYNPCASSGEEWGFEFPLSQHQPSFCHRK